MNRLVKRRGGLLTGRPVITEDTGAADTATAVRFIGTSMANMVKKCCAIGTTIGSARARCGGFLVKVEEDSYSCHCGELFSPLLAQTAAVRFSPLRAAGSLDCCGLFKMTIAKHRLFAVAKRFGYSRCR